jgi:predicted nucleotidyltransferase component of viral defense system
VDPAGLRRLAGQRGIALGILEKDQAVTVALGAIASEACARYLVFKGGTALSKVYFRDYRFSQDLDFTALRDVSDEIMDAEPRILEAGQRAGVRLVRLARVPGGRGGRVLKLRYEDMNGHPNHILVQMSLREKVLLPAEARPIRDQYDVLSAAVRMPTMDLREIVAEKVRALYMRSQARDLFDLGFLLGKEVRPDAELIAAKLGWWKGGLRLDPETTGERIDLLEAVWERDLEPLVDRLPPFDEVASRVKASLARASRSV